MSKHDKFDELAEVVNVPDLALKVLEGHELSLDEKIACIDFILIPNFYRRGWEFTVALLESVVEDLHGMNEGSK